VDLPRNKRVEYALRYIFGIGLTSSQAILKEAEVNPSTRAKDLTEEEISRIKEIIDKKYKVEGELKSEVTTSIKRLMDIGSYKGLRHRKGLPVNGQRTKTNSRTRKGPKKTVGAKRKKAVKSAL
ncbi:MAG: 30S ribosomal protein S13, partial [Candidatus Caldatribacteriota bacterium]|nr:30S ribosomal protein S13 [Candidatus Caldatribacteriota bacterium]